MSEPLATQAQTQTRALSVSEAVEQRRAVKHFDPEHRMSEEAVRTLLGKALLSPTAFNIQHWRIVRVEDPELRKQIRAVAWDQAQVTDASLLLVMCMDVQAWRKEPQRYWRNAPEPVQDFLLPAIQGYYEGREGVQRDEAMRSIGIISQSLMLLAKEMGYDTCPMDGFDFDAVARLINLPEDHAIGLMLAVGKAVQEANPRGGQLALDEVLLSDRFPG